MLVDTNRYMALASPDHHALERLQQASEVWLSLVTIAELKSGFAMGSRRSANESRLEQFIHTQGVGVLLPDLETAQYYADLTKTLRRLGKPIPTNDIWIAAQALQHNLTLDTLDQHFQHVPKLKLVKSPR